MPVTVIKKKGVSNKTQIRGKKLPHEGHSAVPSPFMDRLSVVMDVPTETDGKEINQTIWGAISDKAVFHPQGGGKWGPYNRAYRVSLASLPDARKWPLLQFGYADHLVTKFRIEFVPADLGVQGLEELHAVLVSVMPNGWRYFIENGRVTRIDVAVDLPTARMQDFHFLPHQGLTSKAWKSNGTLQTYQLGATNGDHFQIYNRKAKRSAQNKTTLGKEGVRIERRLRTKPFDLSTLPSMKNAFTPLTLVKRELDRPTGEKKWVWDLFLDSTEHRGLTAALGRLPADKRTKYRAHLQSQAFGWWDVEAIWVQWPKMLADLKIANPKAW